MKTNITKLRVVIVGAGYFGTKRLEACLRLKNDFTVVGVVEPSRTRAHNVTKQYGVPSVPTLKAIAGSTDLAVVATPNNTHAGVVIDALSQGLHVLCEKPLASTYRDAMRIVHAAKRTRRYVKTGSNHRFIPYAEKVLGLVDAGAVGNILRIHGSIGNDGSRVAHKWFWKREISGGGTLLDNGCHLVDIALVLMPDIMRCSAHVGNVFWKSAGVEDIGSIMCATRDDREAILMSSWIRWNGYLSLEAWGEKGFVKTDSVSERVLLGDTKGSVQAVYDYSKGRTSSYEKELLYLKRCINENKQPEPSAESGARVVRLIESAYVSSRTKKWVTF